ncbi:S1 family peptidase [Streptomyces parvus]|uniref:S1 family peptidase n=1 Tax=Streptomyces parvus TaxID=66428 RepID=UPI001653A96E|nr:S1 family peptidase [Streptomyces parvus]
MRTNSASRMLATALVAIAMAGIPSTAGAADSGRQAARETMLHAMAQDLGTTPQRAAERLRQEEEAARTEQQLHGTLGKNFAGAWFDEKSGRLVVAVTDARRTGEITAAGAVARVASHSLAELNTAKDQLDALANGAAVPQYVTGWYADTVTNSVVVEVLRGRTTTAEVLRFLDEALETSGLVRVAEVDSVMRPEYNVAGGAYYSVGGTACSVGFSARGADGSRKFVTAGHCTRPGGTVYGYNGAFLGKTSGSVFGNRGDFGKVNVTSGNWNVKPWVNTWPNVRVVHGSRAQPVGASVCRSGWKSGWRCGEIVAKNRTVNYGGVIVEDLTNTTACSSPGDSGGAHMSGGQAQGIHSGGPSSGCGALFQPINEVLNAYNLRLVVG